MEARLSLSRKLPTRHVFCSPYNGIVPLVTIPRSTDRIQHVDMGPEITNLLRISGFYMYHLL
jgi:hypothetical protein